LSEIARLAVKQRGGEKNQEGEKGFTPKASHAAPPGLMLIICDGSEGCGVATSSSSKSGRSYRFRAALFVLLALPHDGRAETGAEVLGQFVELGVSIDLDGRLGISIDHISNVGAGKMGLLL